MSTKDYSAKLLEMEGVRIENLEESEKEIVLQISLERRTQICRCCGAETERVHDYRIRHVVVIGSPVVAAVGNNRTGLGFACQVAGCIADDPGLLPAFLQHACAEAAHGHDAHFVPEHLRVTLDFQFLLGSIYGFAGGSAHSGDHAGAPSEDACWICLLMDLILRVKLSLFNDSDTTRSRSVSLMSAHLPVCFEFT